MRQVALSFTAFLCIFLLPKGLETLSICIDPVNSDSHETDTLVNIVAGSMTVLVESIKLGKLPMENYEGCQPKSFHKPQAKPTLTMAEQNKSVSDRDILQYDPGLIYGSVMYLQKVTHIRYQHKGHAKL